MRKPAAQWFRADLTLRDYLNPSPGPDTENREAIAAGYRYGYSLFNLPKPHADPAQAPENVLEESFLVRGLRDAFRWKDPRWG